MSSATAAMAEWRRRPTRKYASQLEDAYVTLVTGGLAQLAKTSALEC